MGLNNIAAGASLDTARHLNVHRHSTKDLEAMTQKTKLRSSFRDAVADIPDGSTIAFSGFAMPGTPFNLIKALLEQGAKRLTLVANTTGGAQQPRMPDIGMLVENGQVAKVICAFTAATRPTDVLPFTKYYEVGRGGCRTGPARHAGRTAARGGRRHSGILHAHRGGDRACRGPRDAGDRWPRIPAGIRAAAGLRVRPRAHAPTRSATCSSTARSGISVR